MDISPTLVNAVIAPLVGILITYLVRTQIRDLRTELKGEIGDVKQDLRDLRSEMRSEFSDVRSEMAGLRSDLTQVALAVGARPRPQTG